MREEGAKEVHDARGGCREIVEFKERVPQDLGEINNLWKKDKEAYIDITE